jgi:hypothetical protein
MRARQRILRVSGAVALLIQLVLVATLAGPAPAGQDDAALFYQELVSYGHWVDYGRYGPVWYPTRVSANWRPYLDGRWVPTSEGWVFETSEPWGWATYHFGNWMPTAEFGWVWVPGSTWYPSTTAWRVGDDLIGWAPIPPPGFMPPPAFAPAGGFIPGTPVLDLLTGPFWIFARSPNFLLGFGEPFIPALSFSNCGCLVPFQSVPTIFPRTFLLTDFFFLRFAPRAFFAYGPPFSSVAVFSNLKLHRLNKFAETVNLRALRNVMPPAAVFSRRPFLRNIIPDPLLRGQRHQVRPARDIRLAERRLARPGVIPPPTNAPRLKTEIPRRLTTSPRKRKRPVVEVIRGSQIVRGLELPPQAELERRVMRPELRRQPRLGATRGLRSPAPGRLKKRRTRKAMVAQQGEGVQLTPPEDNLRRRLEFELLREQVRQSWRLQRRLELLPERRLQPQMGPGFGRGLSPVLPPRMPSRGPASGRAIFGIR